MRIQKQGGGKLTPQESVGIKKKPKQKMKRILCIRFAWLSHNMIYFRTKEEIKTSLTISSVKTKSLKEVILKFLNWRKIRISSKNHILDEKNFNSIK